MTLIQFTRLYDSNRLKWIRMLGRNGMEQHAAEDCVESVCEVFFIHPELLDIHSNPESYVTQRIKWRSQNTMRTGRVYTSKTLPLESVTTKDEPCYIPDYHIRLDIETAISRLTASDREFLTVMMRNDLCVTATATEMKMPVRSATRTWTRIKAACFKFLPGYRSRST